MDKTRAQWAEGLAKYARGSTHKGDEGKWGSWAEPLVILGNTKASTGAGAAAGAGAGAGVEKVPHVATPLEILERFMGADEKQVPKLVDQLVDEVIICSTTIPPRQSSLSLANTQY